MRKLTTKMTLVAKQFTEEDWANWVKKYSKATIKYPTYVLVQRTYKRLTFHLHLLLSTYYPRCVWPKGRDAGGPWPCKVRKTCAFSHTDTKREREGEKMARSHMMAGGS